MALAVLSLRAVACALLLAGAPFPANAAASPVAAPSPPGAPAPIPAAKERCLACHRPHSDAAGRCAACHRGNPATERKPLAHAGFLPAAFSRFTRPDAPEVARGRELLARSGCRRCHVTGGEGTRLAADLDAAFEASPGRLRDAIRLPAAFMPDFRFDERSVEAVVNAIYANGLARTARAVRAQEIPVKVHFAGKAGTTAGPPFTVHCGRCHRALSGLGAGMGEGAVGPNLSALFTPLHPGRPTPTSRWSPETLSRWVANPRSIRRAALMPPVAISAADLEALVESLRIPTANATGARSARLKPLSGNGIIGR